MIEAHRVPIEVPQDLAAELSRLGLAFELPRVRASAFDVAGVISDAAATVALVVTVLQGPATVKALADLVLVRSRTKGMVRIRANGPGGSIDLSVHPGIPRAEIERVVGMVLDSPSTDS